MNPLALFLLLSNDRHANPASGSPRPAASSRSPSRSSYRPAGASSSVRVPAAAATKKQAKQSLQHPAPWPAQAPDWLPPWPMGWQPDAPASKAVIARAAQLIKALHARGLGATAQEYVDGKWITFVARMHGAKKAVEAYRVKNKVVKTAAPKAAQASNVTPAKITPAQAARPTLRAGDGMGVRVALAPHVAELQALLNAHGATIKPDGKFGPLTDGAVREYQRVYKLTVDGIVGPQTWGSLLSESGAA